MKSLKKKLGPVGKIIKAQDIVSTTMIQKLHVDGDMDTKSYMGGMLTMFA